MRKQQYNKVLKHYSKIELVDMVYELGYSFDYQCELLEYSPRERYTDYAINHVLTLIKNYILLGTKTYIKHWRYTKGIPLLFYTIYEYMSIHSYVFRWLQQFSIRTTN